MKTASSQHARWGGSWTKSRRAGSRWHALLVHGNDVELPVDLASGSPFAHFDSGSTLPGALGENMARRTRCDRRTDTFCRLMLTEKRGALWRAVCAMHSTSPSTKTARCLPTMPIMNATSPHRGIIPLASLHVIPGAEYGWRPGGREVADVLAGYTAERGGYRSGLALRY
jgi:hypothetical protein